jgi:hypothetical protein
MANPFRILKRLVVPGSTSGEYVLAENYVVLRHSVFATRPETLGLIEPADKNAIWGVVMETAYAEAMATLVAMADGAVSLYFSNGGGIIGAGSDPAARQAAQALLEMAPQFLPVCGPAAKFPLVEKSHVRFYLLGWGSTFTAEAAEEALAGDSHDLSPLFHQGHKLITEIRLADERQSKHLPESR